MFLKKTFQEWTHIRRGDFLEWHFIFLNLFRLLISSAYDLETNRTPLGTIISALDVFVYVQVQMSLWELNGRSSSFNGN